MTRPKPRCPVCLLATVVLALWAGTGLAQAPGPPAATAASAGAAPPAPAAAPVPADATLTSRLLARQQAIATDIAVTAEQRQALDAALGQLLAISRVLDDAGLRVAAARAERANAEAAPSALDVEAAFAEWLARLPANGNGAEIWPRISRLAEEVRALRQSEQDLVSAAQTGGGEGIEADPVLANPVPVDTLLASLPEVPGHARALAALARELEQRRIDIALATMSERRRGLVDRVRRMGAERAAITDRVALAQRKQQYLQQQLERIVTAQLDLVRAVAQRAAPTAAPDTPDAAAVAALPGLADEVAQLLRRGALLIAESNAQDSRLLELSQVWNDTRDRLAVVDASEALGLVLVSDLARTLPPHRIEAQLAGVQRELASMRLRLIDLRSQLASAKDPLPGLDQAALLERARAESPVGSSTLGSVHFRMLVTVEAANLAIAEDLSGYEGTLGELDRRNSALRELIGTRLLWTPSHAPIGPAWFSAMGARVASGKVFAGVQSQAGSVAVPAPIEPAWLLGAAAVVAIGWWWVRKRRARLLAGMTDAGVWDLRRAIAIVLQSALMALPFALLAGLAFRVMRGGDAPSGFYESVVRDPLPGFWTVMVLAGLVLLGSARAAGAHALDWSEDQCRGLRRHAIALLALIVPSHVGVSAAWYRGDLVAIEYESRLVFMLAWLGVAFVFWRALRPGGVWFGIDSGRANLGRRLLRLALTAAAAAAAVMAALGLQITAAAIATEIEGTIGVLATLLVLHALALRSVALGERRAAEWQAVAADLARKEGQPEPVVHADGRSAADLLASGIETRQMVGFLFGVGAAVWLAAQWADLVPALWRLDEIVLWHSSSGDGDATITTPISLLDVLFAITTAALLVVGLRRLPAMADLILRQRSSADAGTRFAVSAVLRYVIAVAGLIATLGLLGVRWSNLQWMAAALTVGLGFGLQEIFANFVSGLILLFERPVRVGDVVTVNDISGTVSNIGTRATTVVDFDGREVLIPNKALITDRLINWTLNSEVTRITVKVGVGYETDPALAHRLLLQAARETPLVMVKPPPVSAFIGFGASNLDFELRAFVAQIEQRVPATNALNQRILALFAEAGVGIDYDQLEVRLVGDQPAPAKSAG